MPGTDTRTDTSGDTGARARALDWVRARRIGGGLALAAAPLALLAGNLVGVDGAADDPRRMARLATDSGGEQVSILLFVLACALLTAGATSALRCTRDRGAALAAAGAVLTVSGAVAFAGVVTTGFYDIGVAEQLPPETAAAISGGVGRTFGATVVLAVGLLALPLGIVLLTTGLSRAAATPVWVPALAFAGLLVLTLVEHRLGGVVGNLLLFAGLARAGFDVVRTRT